MAISYDAPEVLAGFAEKRQIGFPLLSDPGSATIGAYGVRNHEADGTRIEGVPYPGFFLLDADGVVRAKLFYTGYKRRHQTADLLQAVQELTASEARSDPETPGG